MKKIIIADADFLQAPEAPACLINIYKAGYRPIVPAALCSETDPATRQWITNAIATTRVDLLEIGPAAVLEADHSLHIGGCTAYEKAVIQYAIREQVVLLGYGNWWQGFRIPELRLIHFSTPDVLYHTLLTWRSSSTLPQYRSNYLKTNK